MGVPAAPDVAQLHCTFEESTAEWFKNDNMLLYRRYIDNRLVVLIAEDKTSAIEQLSDLSFDSLEVISEVDERSTTFLDLSISLENDSIVFRPYRKPLNYYERLPFSSSHPLLVKRGAFLGEMSRMACLCSFKKDYKTAVYQVLDIYLHRGYPIGMLNFWMKNNYKSKWQSRVLKEKDTNEEQEHLWLKSEYNPLWSKIDLPRIFSTMSDELKRNFPSLKDDTRLRMSLHRTKNFFDWVNAFNK